ncbi:calcineurin subunit B type 1-like [Pecten maximus]|uniref:calcineurin subunit B type 1-like n=1 Tax=Pecten maximus TaxID=6579 RepID=UPI0014585F84|nr:calcineurin subunit B type 1-like [Pecten maximus]
MGNESSLQEVLSKEEIQDLLSSTPFTENQLRKLMKRYRDMDPDGTDGIPYDNMLTMVEFAGSDLAPPIIASLLDKRSLKIYPKSFLRVCALLSDRIKPAEKKKFIFDLFNIYSGDALTHDEIFRLYKLFYSVAISDDHILALTFKALNHPDLETKGQITFQEFEKMIGDQEIVDRMTVDFF